MSSSGAKTNANGGCWFAWFAARKLAGSFERSLGEVIHAEVRSRVRARDEEARHAAVGDEVGACHAPRAGRPVCGVHRRAAVGAVSTVVTRESAGDNGRAWLRVS